MIFRPALTRLIVPSGIAVAAVWGIIVWIIRPLFWQRNPIKVTGGGAPKIDMDWLQTADPWMILGFVTTAMLLLLVLYLQWIPKYVDLGSEGVTLGRWLTADQFIPFNQIIDVDEQPPFQNNTGVICITGFDGKRYYLLKYAYPDWPELYRGAKNRIKSA